MVEAAYLDHYVTKISLLAPWLDDEVIEKVLAEDDRVAKLVRDKYGVGWKLEGPAFDEARKTWRREHIRELHKRLKTDNDTIEFILYYRNLADDLFGSYSHPKRRHRKPGKGMDAEKCRAWFIKRIDDISGVGIDKIQSVLATRDDVLINMMKRYGIFNMLVDFQQKVLESDVYKELVSAIVERTEADQTEVEIILHYEELLQRYCGAPQRP